MFFDRSDSFSVEPHAQFKIAFAMFDMDGELLKIFSFFLLRPQFNEKSSNNPFDLVFRSSSYDFQRSLSFSF